jgi:hypothetical protein
VGVKEAWAAMRAALLQRATNRASPAASVVPGNGSAGGCWPPLRVPEGSVRACDALAVVGSDAARWWWWWWRWRWWPARSASASSRGAGEYSPRETARGEDVGEGAETAEARCLGGVAARGALLRLRLPSCCSIETSELPRMHVASPYLQQCY